MKKLLVVGALGGILVGLVPLPAHAGASTNAALGLGAFAVFNQVFGGWGWRHQRVVVVRPYAYYSPYPVVSYPVVSYPVVYAAPAVAYAPAAVYAPPAPAIQREVVYPHGRYILQGDGVTVPYQWVWIPNPPPPPAPPAASTRP